MPGWHSVEQLGGAVVKCFNLDQDYCAGENLNFIISEAFAALRMALTNTLCTWLRCDDRADESVSNIATALIKFTESVLLGTHSVTHPELTLRELVVQLVANEASDD